MHATGLRNFAPRQLGLSPPTTCRRESLLITANKKSSTTLVRLWSVKIVDEHNVLVGEDLQEEETVFVW
jgi:hypothetical protein